MRWKHDGERFERWARGAAVVVGRVVVRGVARMPGVVARASGVAQPSMPATVAGVVSAGMTLARAPLGPIAGTCVDAGATAAVLAIATWSVRASTGDDACAVVLAALVADAEGHASPALVHVATRRCVSRVLARTFGKLPAPLRAWSAMGDAARLVDGIERFAARLTEDGAPTALPAAAA